MNALMSLKSAGLAAVVTAALAAPAAAQVVDYTLPSNYGSQNVNSGFLPDPISVSVRAGGTVSASQIGPSCRGYVSRAPDYEINYRAGNFPLTFFVRSSSDTTLVVNAPDARYYCNDDTDGLNPAVIFNRPQSGVYDIWVGTYGQTNSFPAATLYITEYTTRQ